MSMPMKTTEIVAVDAHIRLERKLAKGVSAIAESESAYITGETGFGPNPDFLYTRSVS